MLLFIYLLYKFYSRIFVFVYYYRLLFCQSFGFPSSLLTIPHLFCSCELNFRNLELQAGHCHRSVLRDATIARSSNPTCPVRIAERYFAALGDASDSVLPVIRRFTHSKRGLIATSHGLSYTRNCP